MNSCTKKKGLLTGKIICEPVWNAYSHSMVNILVTVENYAQFRVIGEEKEMWLGQESFFFLLPFRTFSFIHINFIKWDSFFQNTLQYCGFMLIFAWALTVTYNILKLLLEAEIKTETLGIDWTATF